MGVCWLSQPVSSNLSCCTQKNSTSLDREQRCPHRPRRQHQNGTVPEAEWVAVVPPTHSLRENTPTPRSLPDSALLNDCQRGQCRPVLHVSDTADEAVPTRVLRACRCRPPDTIHHSKLKHQNPDGPSPLDLSRLTARTRLVEDEALSRDFPPHSWSWTSPCRPTPTSLR